MKDTRKLQARIKASFWPPLPASVARRAATDSLTEASMESIFMVKMPSMASLVAPILLSACEEALIRSPFMVFDRIICIADIYETACQPLLAQGQQQGAKGVMLIKGNPWHE